MNPHAMNIGMNLGRTAGAGIDEHIHYHIVPRWDGDTNFMPIIAGTKVVSESLQASFEKLSAEFDKLYK
jgi:ATP adenylyltransferase